MENEHRRKAVLFLLKFKKHLTKCNYKVKMKM
mgnify:CR=1 FL=1|nr:MAG TPA: hypothetical protein [Caudoviricetes sp.]